MVLINFDFSSDDDKEHYEDDNNVFTKRIWNKNMMVIALLILYGLKWKRAILFWVFDDSINKQIKHPFNLLFIYCVILQWEIYDLLI